MKPIKITLILLVGLLVASTNSFCMTCEEKKTAADSHSQAADEKLLAAARTIDLEDFKQAIRQGANPNATDADHLTALFIAAGGGNENIVRYLINDLNFDPNSLNSVDNTILHVAARSGHLNIVSYLINYTRINVNAKNRYGETALYHAAEQDHVNVMHFLIKEAKAFLDADSGGNTILHIAAQQGHTNAVQFIVNQKLIDVATRNNNGQTALEFARSRGTRNQAIEKILSR